MDWDRLRVFHTVAEIGNLTHAGYILNLSQSAVSRQISALESELSTPLFSRHARGLVLTAEGEILFSTTRSIFAQLSATTAQLAESNMNLRGTLKVSASVALGSVWLAPRLPRFFKKCPDINLQLVLTDEEVDFTMREADIAIRFGRGENDKSLVYEPLFDFSLKIYGSPQYFESFPIPKTPEELDDHRLIVFGNHAVAPVENVNWILRLGAKTGNVRQPFLMINNAYGILQSVKNGLGIASLADFVAHDHAELIPILPKLKYPQIEAFLVYPKQLSESKRIEVFRDFLKKELQIKSHEHP